MRDDFDLHVGALGQAGDLHGGARREIFREILRVNIVHGNEVGEVGEKHGGFHDVGKGQSLVIENGLYILQHAVGLRLDAADDEAAILGIDGDLSGTEQEVANAHGVIIRAEGGG